MSIMWKRNRFYFKTIKELEKKVILKSSENITKLNKSLKDLTEKNLKEYDKLKDIKQQLKNKAKIYIESLENKKKDIRRRSK